MPAQGPTAFITYAPIVISVFALIIAGLSLWISRLNYRRAVLAERPTASATLRPIGQQEGWYRVDVTVENRSPVGQRWTEIEFRRPRRARAIPERTAYADNKDINAPRRLMNPLPQDQARRSLEDGSEPAFLIGHIKAAEGDRHVRSLFAFVPPSKRARTLSIRVSLVSTEAVERATVIDIHRTLPHAISTAPA